MNRPPYFSIVIPVYNREDEIQRAIWSCLAQDFKDFEIVVVDDASTDATGEVVRGIPDPRVRLISRSRNGGECPARNNGVDAASGEWIVWLDSDHELLPSALQRLKAATSAAAEDVGRVGFMCRFDDGLLSPFPPPSGEVLGYHDHIRWFERSRTSDLLMATRRSTFRVCRMPETRVTPLLYHLDFSKQYNEQWIPEILVLQRTDSPNRITAGYQGADAAKRRPRAEDDLKNVGEIMERHGQALRLFAPKLVEALGRERVAARVVIGPWFAGMAEALRHLVKYPFSPLSWAILGPAACGPRGLLFFRRWWQRRIEGITRRRCVLYAPPVEKTLG